jgi:hypothetical protein
VLAGHEKKLFLFCPWKTVNLNAEFCIESICHSLIFFFFNKFDPTDGSSVAVRLFDRFDERHGRRRRDRQRRE